MAASWGLLSGTIGRGPVSRNFGRERLVSSVRLPELDGEMCLTQPASAGMTRAAGTPQASGGEAGASRANSGVVEEVAKRPPVRILRDTASAYSGVAVDPVRNEVVIADENQFNLLVYDRLENTPPNARLSEPKRIIGGEETFLEYTCSVYIDPATGEIYGVNNDTMNWVPVFSRDAKGNAKPSRKLATPHTTFGIAVDEQAREMFFTIQDDHAVVVYKKTAQEDDGALRSLQGPHTMLADPHGIAIDDKAGLIYVTNWGSSNERLTPEQGGAGPEKPNWPLGRDNNIPSSGKFQPPSIAVFSKGATGDTPPLRVIQGPKTQLNWPTSIAVHPDRGEIFVANDTADTVTVYRSDSSGDVVPMRVLKGPRTMIKNPTGVAVDLKNSELWVANFGSHTATVFAIDAAGNAPPLRAIRSGPIDQPAPMLGNPHTVAFDSKREELLVGN